MHRTLLLLAAFAVSSQAAEPVVSVAKFRGGALGAVSYTFDDGYAEHYTLAAPELERRGFRGTFFINGSKINADTAHRRDTTRMAVGELGELSRRGHEISNHGWAHRNFARFPLDTLRRDVELNDSAILAWTGVRCVTFAYPNNNKRQPGRAMAEQGRVATRTECRSAGSKRSLSDLNSWVDGLMRDGAWGVGMTHGLTYGYDAYGNPSRFWQHLDYVRSLGHRVWVATFRDIASYTRERDETILRVKQHKHRMTVKPKCRLDSTLFLMPLTLAVSTVGDGGVTATQGHAALAVTVRDGTAYIDFSPFGGTVTIDY